MTFVCLSTATANSLSRVEKVKRIFVNGKVDDNDHNNEANTIKNCAHTKTRILQSHVYIRTESHRECLSSTKLLANGNYCMMLKHDEVHLYFLFDLFEFIVLLIVGLCSVGSVFIHLSHCSNGSVRGGSGVGSSEHSQLDNQN